MKARELAELLMQHPDAEVILEDAGAAAIISAESGKPGSGGYHRATGIEAGFTCTLENEIDSDLIFAIPPPDPERYGVRAVRIMGYASAPTPPNRVMTVDKTGTIRTREAEAESEARAPS